MRRRGRTAARPARPRRTSSPRACWPSACVAKRRYRKSRAEQAELPELVGDVLADVGDDAVRPHDHLLAASRFVGVSPSARLVVGGACAFLDPHHPAAGQLAFGLQEHRALRLQDVEGVRPELQAQDVALVGQQVVADVQPRHRLQVRADDASTMKAPMSAVSLPPCSRSCSVARADRRGAPCRRRTTR